ncbi:Glycosyltransferase involved in cell wall bisynthesis [Mucilaginibacter pineti]|uniref:Glycosyltransferase involved in cell wall bisynthesis n=1 Tax=Mucilaginibacter pineti TaxID=1391627 RepID=A0A1G6WAY7_9SPHI|nr:glycosyltransferase family 1 protein [Mucilaginibacter pineti]SDD62397.1 Glycosyltransferase involved in cell wall bisynthesis [Mucilaginibacter pineti]
MNLVFFTHPSFLGSQSMPRFAKMLSEGMAQKGHNVQVWSPKARVRKTPGNSALKKWFGYIDQYIIFPLEVNRRLKSCSPDTLFVFTDHALGPWVPLVAQKKHVIHCHDFLAQRSALGQIPQNPTSKSGRIYQSYINKGYLAGKNFISVSKKTQEDLAEFLPFKPALSKVVYNGLNQSFLKFDKAQSINKLKSELAIDLQRGYILHVGGNQWYKNRVGVIDIYNAYRKNYESALPLLMIGSPPVSEIVAAFNKSAFKNDIHLLTGKDDEFVRSAYAAASVFIFPSLAEGFGWPIAEAMASGCPVVTTNQAPMTEVAGDAAFLVPAMPYDEADRQSWAEAASAVLNNVISMDEDERAKVISKGLLNVKRFDTQEAINEIESIYLEILNNEKL